MQPMGSGWAERRQVGQQGWVAVPEQKLFPLEAKLELSGTDFRPGSAVTQERRQCAHTAAKETRLEWSPY